MRLPKCHPKAPLRVFELSGSSFTLPETNIAPENRPSQKETSLPTIHFQVLLLLVSGRVIRPSLGLNIIHPSTSLKCLDWHLRRTDWGTPSPRPDSLATRPSCHPRPVLRPRHLDPERAIRAKIHRLGIGFPWKPR